MIKNTPIYRAGTLIPFIGIDVIQINLVVAKISATGIAFFWNYFGREYFYFKN